MRSPHKRILSAFLRSHRAGAGGPIRLAAVASLAAAALIAAPLSAAGATSLQHDAVAAHATGDVSVRGEADGTPAGAVQWFKNRIGSTAHQGYCERAVENAYGTTGVWASANAHWHGAGPKHHGDRNPPLGAFVYWNIGNYGHVGISDGAGGFYATSVNGAIGHAKGYGYYSNYRGWTPAAVPRK